MERINHRGGLILQWHDPMSLNAIGPGLASELLSIIQKQPNDLRFLAIYPQPVQTSKGQTFCMTGGNLKELYTFEKSDARLYSQTMSEVCRLLRESPFPTLALLDGICLGGGCELALSCDLRIATTRSRFELRQLANSLCLGYGTNSYLVRLFGQARCQKWLFTSHPIEAQEALSTAVVHILSDDLPVALDQSLDYLLKVDPQAFATQKQLLSFESSPHSNLDHEVQSFANLWKNPGHQSFLERFKP